MADDGDVRVLQVAEETVVVEYLARELVRDLHGRGPFPSPRLMPRVLRRTADMLEDDGEEPS